MGVNTVEDPERADLGVQVGADPADLAHAAVSTQRPDQDHRVLCPLRQHDAIRDRTLEISFLEPGAEAYVFTFG